MKRLVIESWFWLFLCDLLMLFGGLTALYRLLELQETSPVVSSSDRRTIGALVHAANLACVFYFKNVKCLQRSTVTTVLLRRNGWSAQMVLAAQLIPIRHHAWVEFNGQIVNDKPYMREIYHVIDRR